MKSQLRKRIHLVLESSLTQCDMVDLLQNELNKSIIDSIPKLQNLAKQIVSDKIEAIGNGLVAVRSLLKRFLLQLADIRKRRDGDQIDTRVFESKMIREFIEKAENASLRDRLDKMLRLTIQDLSEYVTSIKTLEQQRLNVSDESQLKQIKDQQRSKEDELLKAITTISSNLNATYEQTKNKMRK